MKQILRAFLFLLLFTATGNTAMADEKANVTKQGTVRGRIIDATKHKENQTHDRWFWSGPGIRAECSS